MKAMLIKDGGRLEWTEAADPVIESDDLRGNACRRSRNRARPSVFGQKNTEKANVYFISVLPFFV